MGGSKMLISLLIGLSIFSQLINGMSHRLQHKCESGEEQPIVSITVIQAKTSRGKCPEGFVRIDQDLNEGAGGDYVYLCISRGEPRYGSPLTALTSSSGPEFESYCQEGFHRVRQDCNKKAGGDYVFWCYARGGPKAVTNIYFLNSTVTDCFEGDTKIPGNFNSGTSGNTIEACYSTGCTLSLIEPTPLVFRPKRLQTPEFRLLHLTDTHFGETTDGDVQSQFSVQSIVLKAEDPDLVIITGDAVSGYAYPGNSSGWFADVYAGVVEPMIALGYRWAYTNGNHDPEADLSKSEVVAVDIELGRECGGLSHTIQGPESITGASNYVLPIYSYSRTSVVFNFWLFDSGQDNCEGVKGWGCIYPDQVEWYQEKAANISRDRGYLPPAYAFFHIPLQEFMEPDYSTLDCVGLKDEPISCSSVNTGLFGAALEVGDIKGFFVGHDHDSDFLFQRDGIVLSYGRKTGYGGYGPPRGWLRGGRVLQFIEGTTTYNSTWIRNQDGAVEVLTTCPTWSEQSICAGAESASAESRCTEYEAHIRSLRADGHPLEEMSYGELRSFYEKTMRSY